MKKLPNDFSMLYTSQLVVKSPCISKLFFLVFRLKKVESLVNAHKLDRVCLSDMLADVMNDF